METVSYLIYSLSLTQLSLDFVTTGISKYFCVNDISTFKAGLKDFTIFGSNTGSSSFPFCVLMLLVD